MNQKDTDSLKRRTEIHAADYKRKHHFVRWLIVIILIIALGVGGYFTYVYLHTRNAINRTYDPKTSVHIKSGEFNGHHKFAVLLMGTDTGALERHEKVGNTDTMILCLVNPQKKRYSLISIPRDTMAQMIGDDHFNVQKINAAYSIGGAKMSMATVSQLINVPLKYYALVNMGGIMKMIRYVGGINIRPTMSFEYGGYIFKKGQLTHMGGAGALAYTRMRYDDPQGDYGRQKRQRQVIITLIKKAVSLGTLTNLDHVLSSISGNVKTNLTFDAMQAIAMNYRGSSGRVKSDYLHGIGANIDDAAYQIQPDSELQRISNYCRRELGLKSEKVSNNETYQNKRNRERGFDFNSAKVQNYHIYDDYEEGQ